MTIFAQFGRFFFEKNRPWLFFCLLSLPFFLALGILLSRLLQLREIEQTFDAAASRGRSALEKRLQKEQFLQRYREAEPYFIDQCLESLPLLERERRELLAMKNHPACSNRDKASRRIAFLAGPENRLAFAEENIRSSKSMKETEERLIHPVEIDLDDLEHLLALIEDLPVGAFHPNPHSPQLLIQDFRLTKKTPAVFELNLSMIKRDFLHEKKN